MRGFNLDANANCGLMEFCMCAALTQTSFIKHMKGEWVEGLVLLRVDT